jgi:hypothetical protein
MNRANILIGRRRYEQRVAIEMKSLACAPPGRNLEGSVDLETASVPAVADVADEPRRNGRLLPVKRAGACTAEVRGSNPLRSTTKSAQIDVISFATE